MVYLRMVKPIRQIIDFFKARKKRKEKEKKAYQESLERARQQEILKEKREQEREKKKKAIERERAEKKRKIRERKNWAQAQKYKYKANKKLILDIEKNKPKIISEQEFHKPKIEVTKTGCSLFFKGKEFLFCKEGFEIFEEDFLNEVYYKLIVDEGYLARKHNEQEYIQYFHRWLMKEEIGDFVEEIGVETEDVEVHHIDLTTTNNRVNNLKPMLKKDHEKLHIRLKFVGSNDSFENWYEKKDD